MSIAITDEHRALAKTGADFLDKNDARAAARGLLTAENEERPAFWREVGQLGWLGLHLPEEHGGSGFGLPELVIVAEEMGRAVAPGPFVPTVIASAVLAAAGSEQAQAKLLPGLADGSVIGAVALGGNVSVSDGKASGQAGTVLSGRLADVLLVASGDDAAIIDCHGDGVTITVPANLDPARRAARVTLDGAPAEVLPGAGQVLTDLARTILAAEAAGVARATTDLASAYAKVREQFGRPIGMFQAVKHHCANMLVGAELATGAVWDAARAAAAGGDQFTYTAAIAAALALAAADENANLNTQVHGGIGFTWEHDAHLYLRRATAIEAIIDAEAAAVQVTGSVRKGVKRARAVDLPEEAEPIRAVVREFIGRVADLDEDARRKAMIESGYVMPNWPKPWGRDAGAVEQLVIEQEFSAAGIKRPSYGITSWVILTLIQYATPEQVSRWVVPALNQEVIWCQLFSEPGAGSDAAGVRTRATRTEDGWLINGQKVWTSGAHLSRYGLATVRTNPDAPKHNGITMMVIDLKADGVTVRPLKMATGNSDFNEVFFDNVFVSDADVVGPVDGGWTVARATLGNESVSIGGGGGGMAMPSEAFIAPFDAHPERLPGGAGRVGRHIARTQAMGVLNLRSAHRAVAGGEPGPEGNVTKLLLSEIGHESAAILAALAGPDLAFAEGPGALGGALALGHRAMSIAGGTSEIKRNQIGERILGLPRDPLIR
ncbi:MAG: acyl-CoA dehydrogenase [Nocardiopsaceae bacterium]|jgi:alkylation response protein AidB-like acyl-CoA dehydrogenase|nr:acyl-CoA dehydrogenase [Nocardiopsaceae bacterium]